MARMIIIKIEYMLKAAPIEMITPDRGSGAVEAETNHPTAIQKDIINPTKSK
jgi:hypothetical protein